MLLAMADGLRDPSTVLSFWREGFVSPCESLENVPINETPMRQQHACELRRCFCDFWCTDGEAQVPHRCSNRH